MGFMIQAIGPASASRGSYHGVNSGKSLHAQNALSGRISFAGKPYEHFPKTPFQQGLFYRHVIEPIERHVIYRPHSAYSIPELTEEKKDFLFNTHGMEVIQSPEGYGNFHALFLPPKGNKPVMIFSYGSACNANRAMSEMAEVFAPKGYGLMVLENAGFGSHQDVRPNEQRLYQEAEEAYRYLTTEKQIPSSRIIISGFSLGSAVATYLSQHHPNALLTVLFSPMTNLTDVTKNLLQQKHDRIGIMRHAIRHLLPYMQQQYDSSERLPEMKSPLMIYVGEKDSQMPADKSSKAILNQTTGIPASQKKLILVRDARHRNLLQTIKHQGDRIIDEMETFLAPIAHHHHASTQKPSSLKLSTREQKHLEQQAEGVA